jgi:Ca2+-binding RTX toxin-like protein
MSAAGKTDRRNTKQEHIMARITAKEAFNTHSFSFGGATAAAAATVIGNAGGYRYGINRFENTITTPFNAGTERATVYGDDVSVLAGNITGGTVGAYVAEELSGTRWVSSFVISQMDMSAVAYQSALRSASALDDQAFLDAAMAGDDLALMSKFADHIDSFAGDDTVRGAGGNDSIYAMDGDDSISGDAGNDELFGGDGTDRLWGAYGADTILGGDGSDRLAGGNGNDQLSGGSGTDVFYFRVGDDKDTITAFGQGSDKLEVSGMTGTTTWTKTQVGADVSIKVLGLEVVVLNADVADFTISDFIL